MFNGFQKMLLLSSKLRIKTHSFWTAEAGRSGMGPVEIPVAAKKAREHIVAVSHAKSQNAVERGTLSELTCNSFST